jgi:hypothetical protein
MHSNSIYMLFDSWKIKSFVFWTSWMLYQPELMLDVVITVSTSRLLDQNQTIHILISLNRISNTNFEQKLSKIYDAMVRMSWLEWLRRKYCIYFYSFWNIGVFTWTFVFTFCMTTHQGLCSNGYGSFICYNLHSIIIFLN